jgi:hypothetical protein
MNVPAFVSIGMYFARCRHHRPASPRTAVLYGGSHCCCSVFDWSTSPFLAWPARDNNEARQRRFCWLVTSFESHSHFESKHSTINQSCWLLLRRRRLVPAAFCGGSGHYCCCCCCCGGCCYCVGGSLLGWPCSCWLLLQRWRIVAAAADCCGGDGSVQLLKQSTGFGLLLCLPVLLS